MSYLIKKFMTTNIVTIDLKDSAFDAAEAMVQDPHATGYVIVLQQGKPTGIVTERDIIHKVIAKQLVPDTITAASIMSTPLVTITPDADFFTAPELMREHDIRQLVVVKDDILYGVITAKAVAAQCNTYINQTVRDIIRWTAIGF